MRLIDADEVVSVFDYYITHGQVMRRQFNSLFYSGMQDAYARARSIVLEMPTIDPLKHGRWIDDYNVDEYPLFRNGCKCSACGFRTSYGKPKYCMNCGARMDGESNET